MFVYGYKKSSFRTFVCYTGVALTLGILRLVLHWWSHWLLFTTHKPCSLEEAEKVLVKEKFQGKHAIYYIKSVATLTSDRIRYVQTLMTFRTTVIILTIFRSDSVKKAELDECFSERFTEHANDFDNEFYRQLEFHLSDGKFQREFPVYLTQRSP